jgi:hypothetical protein
MGLKDPAHLASEMTESIEHSYKAFDASSPAIFGWRVFIASIADSENRVATANCLAYISDPHGERIVAQLALKQSTQFS